MQKHGLEVVLCNGKFTKNAIDIKNFNQLAFQYFGGIDLMAIEGASHDTVMAIMSEIGIDGFKKFKISKEFGSWVLYKK